MADSIWGSKGSFHCVNKTGSKCGWEVGGEKRIQAEGSAGAKAQRQEIIHIYRNKKAPCADLLGFPGVRRPEAPRTMWVDVALSERVACPPPSLHPSSGRESEA